MLLKPDAGLLLISLMLLPYSPPLFLDLGKAMFVGTITLDHST
jgi:hypothetical protein